MIASRISRRDVAQLIGVSADTLGDWAARRTHDFPKPLPRMNGRGPIYYDRQAVEVWVEARAKSPPADRRVARISNAGRLTQ